MLLHVAHPSLAPPGLVLDIKDSSPQFCVPSNPVLSVTSISPQLLSGSTLSTGEVPVWSHREKIRQWRLKTGFFSLATNPVLLPDFMMDTSLFKVAQLELFMINVPSASKLAPSMAFKRRVCHQHVVHDLRHSSPSRPPFICSLATTCTLDLKLCSM